MRKKWLLLTFVFFVLMLIAARWTKPDEGKFLHIAQEKINDHADGLSKDPVMIDVVKIQKDFIFQALSKLLVTKEYYFFTVHSITLGDGEFRYLGVFGTFIPLQSEDPLQKFYKNEE
jgi:hypothetical protein